MPIFQVNIDDLTACQWGESSGQPFPLSENSGCGEVLTKLSFVLSGFLSMNLPSRLPRNAASREAFPSHPAPGAGGHAVGAHPVALPTGDWRVSPQSNAPEAHAIFPETHLSLCAFLKIRTREKTLSRKLPMQMLPAL